MAPSKFSTIATVNLFTLIYILSGEYAIRRIKTYYTDLTNVQISLILPQLYAKNVIILQEKLKIETLKSESDKMQYILDKIITPSLKIEMQKFEGFRQTLGIINSELFKRLGKYIMYVAT